MTVSKVQFILSVCIIGVFLLVSALIAVYPVLTGVQDLDPYLEYLKSFAGLFGALVGAVVGFYFGKYKSDKTE